MSTRDFVTTIKGILAPLAGSSAELPLAEVNAYDKKEGLSLPAVNITVEEPFTVNREDTAHNERTTIVTVRLLVANIDGETAELARLDVIDAILDKLDQQSTIDTLNGVQDIWEVSEVVRFESDDSESIMGWEFFITGRNAVEFT